VIDTGGISADHVQLHYCSPSCTLPFSFLSNPSTKVEKMVLSCTRQGAMYSVGRKRAWSTSDAVLCVDASVNVHIILCASTSGVVVPCGQYLYTSLNHDKTHGYTEYVPIML
jgi:hypothetical protein